MAIRACIADDHLLILTAIRRALETAGDIEVVGAARRGDEHVALVDAQRPALALLDHRVPDMDGVACLKLLKQRHPQTKLVMLSASEDDAQISKALAAGASAYIGKRIDPSDLASTLRQVVDEVVVHRAPGSASRSAPRRASGPPASRRAS